jgi:hypothetical protein
VIVRCLNASRSLILGRSPRRSPSFDHVAAHILASQSCSVRFCFSSTGGKRVPRRVSSCSSAPILLPFLGCSDGALSNALALRTVLRHVLPDGLASGGRLPVLFSILPKTSPGLCSNCSLTDSLLPPPDLLDRFVKLNSQTWLVRSG